MTAKLEYKLYKTKSKLSSMLSAVNLLQINKQQQTQPQQLQSHYILVEFKSNQTQEQIDSDGLDSVWFNRNTGEIKFKKTKNLNEYDEVGKVFGYVGKFQVNSNVYPRLLFIKKCEQIGKLQFKTEEHFIYRIKELLMLPLSPPGSIFDENDSLGSIECDVQPNSTPTSNNSFNMTSLNSSSNNILIDLDNSTTPTTPTTMTTTPPPSKVQNTTDKPLINIESSPSLSSSNSQINNKNSSFLSSPQALANTKFEKKISEEIIKIFQDNNGSFYFSYTYDLTNSVERNQEKVESNVIGKDRAELPLSYWRTADDRFFWNKILLNDLININVGNVCIDNENSITIDVDESRLVAYRNLVQDKFIVPIIQGFAQTDAYENKLPNLMGDLPKAPKNSVDLKICLISRRSRFRLGIRFKRRGADENGNVANFVETEQILNVYDGHTLSFVIIRGSIPIYWSQPGIKYRPAPRIDKSKSENQLVFKKHFEQIEQNYSNASQIVIVNLIEEYGKESLLGDAYVELLANLDRQKTLYVQFDFHEHCKGLKFENVLMLKDKLINVLSDQAFCWIDKKGFIYKQKSIIRVNCVDCLDRTNVVQMVLAKHILENQLIPLGVLVPPPELPIEFKKKFLLLWANNGDAISEQYAGTSALKGDYTRTGERHLTGIMKDGVKSANRFVLRFRENFRQSALEVLQGVSVVEEDLNGVSATTTNNSLKVSVSANNIASQVSNKSDDNSNSSTSNPADEAAEREREENVKQLVSDCRKQLVEENQDCYGSWALINYSETADANQVDPDVFLLFTSSAIYISNYDESNETFVDYQRIDLKDVEKLEMGPEPVSSQQTFFKTTPSAPRFYIMRIYYKNPDESNNNSVSESASGASNSGYFHSFRSCNLRFFNNLVITTKSIDEQTESLRGICHTIQSTTSYFGYDISFEENNKLTRKKSKTHQNLIQLSQLTGRMSIDNSEKYLPQIQPNSKLVKFKKMFNYKIFGGASGGAGKLTTTKSPNEKETKPDEEIDYIKPMSLEPSASTQFFESTKDYASNQDQQQQKQHQQTSNGDNLLIDLSSSPASERKLQSESVGGVQSLFENAQESTGNASNKSNILIELADLVTTRNDNLSPTWQNTMVKNKSSESFSSLTTNQSTITSSASSFTISNSSSKSQYPFVPKLSQKQYVNRDQKLKDIKKLIINDSKTSFVFI